MVGLLVNFPQKQDKKNFSLGFREKGGENNLMG
jgi:hypothetical protein